LVLNGRLLLIKLWLRRPANCAVDFLVVAWVSVKVYTQAIDQPFLDFIWQ
jgi:hypothetical protein